MPVTFVNGNKIAYAHERITTMTSSTGLTAAKYAESVTTIAPFDQTRRADEVFITVETAEIRATFDGTTPTTTATTAIGHQFEAGDTIVLQGYQSITQFRAINAAAGNNAALQVTYFRR